MGVRIQVNGKDDRPKKNYSVFVKWSDGFSRGTTDSDGLYDTNVEKGTIEYVEIYSEIVLGKRSVSNGELITVKTGK
jgi:hypothetical protein